VTEEPNFFAYKEVQQISGPWQVRFDPTWGGPEQPVPFAGLTDWSQHSEPGVKYYSGIATYETHFDVPSIDSALSLDLGQVADMARVTLNDQDLGVVWSHPYRVNIPAGLLRERGNELKIEVVNTWHNRLVGDQQSDNKDVRLLQWESGLMKGREFKAGRYTFATQDLPKPDAKLNPAGLLGPVRIVVP
jgi:rhodanese-related sulfurtransferase